MTKNLKNNIMKKLTLKIIFIFVAVLSSISSCSKDDDEKTELVIEKSNNIEASKSNVAPLEVVQLYSKISLSQNSYKAQFMGSEITLGKVNDTTLVFMVPKTLANKEGDLTFLVQGKQEELNFKVSALNLVTNPDEEIKAYIQEMIEGIEENSDTPALIEYKKIFQENMAAFNTAYSTLSVEDKILVVSFLKINLPADDANRAASETEPCLDLMSKRFLWYVGKTVVSAGVLAAAILAPEPVLTKLAATLVAAKFVLYLHKTTNTVEMLVNCIRIKEYTSIETSNKVRTEMYKFDNLREYKVNFFGKYESLSKKDLDSDNSFLKGIAIGIENFKIKLSEYKQTYNSFVNFLGLPSFLNLDVTEMLPTIPLVSETKAIENTKISKVSITTDKVIVKKNGIEGSAYIMSFSNKTIEKQFFDIQFEGEDEGFVAKGTFNAELEASDGKIVVQGGNEKAVDENNEATVLITIRNEEEAPVDNAKVELSSASSDVSFPSGNSLVTGANGQVNFKVKISKESSQSSFVVVVKLKNEAGEVIDQTNIVVNVGLEALLINGSPWKVTSYIVDGWNAFNLMETGNEACYPAGIYDTQRMLEATYNFSQGIANMTSVWSFSDWDCDSASYVIHQENQSISFIWRIDNSTGKFVVTMNGVENAWLNVQVSGDKISMSGPIIIDDGEESTWSMQLEK